MFDSLFCFLLFCSLLIFFSVKPVKNIVSAYQFKEIFTRFFFIFTKFFIFLKDVGYVSCSLHQLILLIMSHGKCFHLSHCFSFIPFWGLLLSCLHPSLIPGDISIYNQFVRFLPTPPISSFLIGFYNFLFALHFNNSLLFLIPNLIFSRYLFTWCKINIINIF